MRWDVRVSAHFYLSAAFLSVCVMVAPDYLHLSEAFNRRMSNGDQTHTVAGLAMKGRPSVDFSGYWQRHVQGG
jgi:hypothetical protein